jgi:2-polyprenyl-3-methyl-5-hydroxy-6-metoxy-1,4-benzoquinol methylase
MPFINGIKEIKPGMKVLEIGCGEGGNLKPFLDAGCDVTGVDILEGKINNAKKFFANHPKKANLNLIIRDIYDTADEFRERFDIVFMRDVLEHIHNQEKFMSVAKNFLKPDGIFFLGFPPWQYPFGGHQQMCQSKVLSRLPYIHLLPGPLYPGLLKLFKESDKLVEDLLEIRQTRITIDQFHGILKKEKYKLRKVNFYFMNPNYEIKFGVKPRLQFRFISGIPWIRNFFITTCYYAISK